MYPVSEIAAQTAPHASVLQRIADDITQGATESQFGPFNLFIIFFVKLGPLKIIHSFVQLTQKADRTLSRQLAFRSTAVSTLIIILVVIIGQNILKVWQITLPALMIAAGFLLFSVALSIVMMHYNQLVQEEPPEKPELHLAITPLAFPTILTPFGIAIALTLMIIAPGFGIQPVVVLLLLLLVMGLNLVSMLAAKPILMFIRPVTLKILGFTLGVMQLALGVEFILLGLEIEVLVIRNLLRL
ncbi:MAG: MarC family protein [Microcoleaceae cyanobacterium]